MTSGLDASARIVRPRGARPFRIVNADVVADLSRSSPPLLGLFDRHGRFWEWHPDRPRYLGAEPGVFQHEALTRTESEIEAEAEPVIEVYDARLLRTRLEPVPAVRISLGDIVLLPGTGALSQVIGLFDCTECTRHRERCLFVCTDNDDWAHRSESSPVLLAVPPGLPHGQRVGASGPTLRLV